MTKKSDEVMACMNCGSADISGLKFDSAWKKGSLPVSGIYCCQKCGYEGLPIIFDNMEIYEKFIKENTVLD